MATAWKLYGIKKTCLTGKQVVGVKAVGSVVNTHWILNSNYMSEHTTLTLCQVEAENIVQRKWVLIACLIETNCAVCDCLSAAAAAWCRLHCCEKQADDNNIVYETGKHESKKGHNSNSVNWKFSIMMLQDERKKGISLPVAAATSAFVLKYH